HVARAPAALVLKRLGQVPVGEGGQRADVTVEHALEERAVEVEAALVGRPAAARLDAWPGDREAVALEPERSHQVEIFLREVVMLASGSPGVAVGDVALDRCEPVPDRLAASVGRRCALDLEGGCGSAPHRSVPLFHPFTAPFMIPPMICLPSTRKITISGRIEMKVPA